MTVFLNLLMLAGAREGSIEQLEFPSAEDAIKFATSTYGQPGFVPEDIQDADGNMLITERALRAHIRNSRK